MRSLDKQTTQTLIQAMQLVALVIAILTVTISIGRRDAEIGRNIQDINELRKISQDLLRTSISQQMTDEFQNRQLMELLTRIEKLES